MSPFTGRDLERNQPKVLQVPVHRPGLGAKSAKSAAGPRSQAGTWSKNGRRNKAKKTDRGVRSGN